VPTPLKLSARRPYVCRACSARVTLQKCIKPLLAGSLEERLW